MVWKRILAIASAALLQTEAASCDFGVCQSVAKDPTTGEMVGTWDGCEKGTLTDDQIRSFMHADEKPTAEQQSNFDKNLEYIKEIVYEAQQQKVDMYQVGVTKQCYDKVLGSNVMQVAQQRTESTAKDIVRNHNKIAVRTINSRRLQSSSSSLNWCTTDNPKGRSVCSPVKNQRQCGSCWAFSAADTIEAAASYSSGNASIPISVQQFLDCSWNAAQHNFDYCWVDSAVTASAPWMEDQIIWKTQNQQCNGGMPFAAFVYAARSPVGIVSATELPYTDGKQTSTSSGSCPINSNSVGAAYINGWAQVKATSCSAGGAGMADALKTALQQGPISTAIATNSAFDVYKKGVYSCTNNGDLSDASMINHAITLVGYTDNSWIIKNSYGSSWGDSGYLYLAMDDKLNCGLSVFPVTVTGAVQGDRSQLPNGGVTDEYKEDDKIMGISTTWWIVIGAGIAIAVVAAVIAGIVSRKNQERRQRQYAMQQIQQPFQVSGGYNQGAYSQGV